MTFCSNMVSLLMFDESSIFCCVQAAKIVNVKDVVKGSHFVHDDQFLRNV